MPEHRVLPDRTSGEPRGEMVYLRTAAIEALDHVRGETLSDRMLAAAAEIERLRHDWHAQVGVLDDEVERLEIKVEQLREALRRFVADVNLVNVPDHVSAALDEERHDD